MSNRIQGTTGLIGLIGDPLKHSRSPHMHNSAFDKLGLDYVYLCFEVPDGHIKEGLDSLKSLNAKGSNITFPHKQAVIKYLDEISPDAKIIGSVNTITIDSETKKIKGYNTDGRGFIASLDELNIPFRKDKVILCGVGGAGRAIAIQLAYEGVGELCIKELNKELSTEIKRTIEENITEVKVRILDDDDEVLKKEMEDTVLFINATPLGMKGREDKCVVSSEKVFHDKVFVYDIVYDPRETLLMKYAKKAGCKTSNGINMMIWQGAIAFKIWFGIDMPQDYVREELFEE
ncbi:shikimate dehydrogenase [Fusobacterium sp. PH5-44]|uniref:shikimate dehydrogenase n=1 Tax=unclassified Fusobacterium TaxID=2648384 RepID=UPI003D1D198F